MILCSYVHSVSANGVFVCLVYAGFLCFCVHFMSIFYWCCMILHFFIRMHCVSFIVCFLYPCVKAAIWFVRFEFCHQSMDDSDHGFSYTDSFKQSSSLHVCMFILV